MVGILKLTPDAAHQPNQHGVITKRKATCDKSTRTPNPEPKLDVLSFIEFIYGLA
jgi:hypothetical protein